MLKRILAFLALAAMIFTTSCAEPATLLAFIPEDTGTNMDGTVIDFAWCPGAAEHPYYIEDTLQYDAFFNRIADINESLNCEIKVELEAEQEPITIAMQTGSDSVDILICNGIDDYMDAKMIYAINDFSDYIDISNEKKYGKPQFQESMMLNGTVYGVTPILWPGFESTGGYLTVYNRDLFKEYQIPDFLEYYENETWTWDTFRYEYMDKYDLQKPDGSTRYLLHTNTSDLYQVVFYSNGLNYIEEKPDGTLSVNPYTEAFTYTMQYWGDLYKENKEKIENDTNTYVFTPYINGDAIAGFAWNAHLVTGPIAYNENSFETGVLPIPCGPHVEYGQWSQTMQRPYGMVLPITSTIPEESAQIIDLLCEPFEEFGGDDGLFDYLRTNVFSTDLDAQIYLDIVNYMRYDYTFVGDRYGREISYVFQDFFESTAMTLTQAMERARPIIDKLTSEYMLGNYEAVYGE